MVQSTARQSAVSAVTASQSNGKRLIDKDKPVGEMFGSNVFSDKVMKERLPDKVYKALRDTIKKVRRSTRRSPATWRRRCAIGPWKKARRTTPTGSCP